MSSHVIDKLVMELELELGKFRSQSQEAERLNAKLKNSIDETSETSEKASGANEKLGETTEKVGKASGKTSISFLAAAKALRGLFASITGSFALERLATSIAKANDQLNFLQQRLNMGSREIKLFGNAAAMLGGDAGAMQNTMQGLNQSIQQLVMMGDASVLPFFNALGIGVVDAYGKVRDMDEIMLDMADSFSGMDTQQGYALASAMGLDEGTTNALMQGRAAMEEMIGLQKTLYTSTQQELDASRELRKQQSLLSAQWGGMKTMLGNAIIPLLTKMTEGAQEFVNFLMRHERSVKNVFEALSYVIGGLLVVALGKAAVAAWALMAPFAPLIAIVTALGAAFMLLYDDYKVWAEGGESLFDWGKFVSYISGVSLSVDNLKSAFARLLTGYNDWDEAASEFNKWARMKGFIDENGVSIGSLARGFRNLAADIMNNIPILQTFADIISRLMSGDFRGAFAAAKDLPKAAGQTIIGGAGFVAEHVAGAVDTLLGHDPAEGGTISAGARWLRQAGNEGLDTLFGSDGEQGSIGRGIDSAMDWLGQAFAPGSSGAAEGQAFSRSASLSPIAGAAGSSSHNEVMVHVGGITVNTSASDLPSITNEALGAAVDKTANNLNQIGSGL